MNSVNPVNPVNLVFIIAILICQSRNNYPEIDCGIGFHTPGYLVVLQSKNVCLVK